jgi:hypothetical protein
MRRACDDCGDYHAGDGRESVIAEQDTGRETDKDD